MSINHFIKNNWGKLSIIDIKEHVEISMYELLIIALKLGLQNINTKNIQRTWTNDEEKFLKETSKVLNIKEAANLIHRSYHATYQRVRLLGLDEMINKKENKQ